MRKVTDTNGQALVEFALVFPVQLVIIMFILQMALIQVARSVVSYAAYCAAHAEILGQDPGEAASIALIPLGEPESAPVYVPEDGGHYELPGDSLPGWGPQPKWNDVRNKVGVYRLYDDDSLLLNRVTLRQTEIEEHRINYVRQHNVGVEVEFPFKLLLPFGFFEAFMPAEQLGDFQEIKDQALVNIDGELYFVLRERCVLPNSGRVINTTLELRDAGGNYEYDEGE
ncbi:MAG: hypothetical protein DRP79_07435 [Planctomycetota bacterium]|nr:MAG: hypothetical protein DRP79_07435 [Planctomycetota bacterium]